MNDLETVLEKTGRILTEQYGIRIVCQGNRCCTDGKVIYLPALPDDVPKELWNTIRGYCDHEAGHLIFRSSFTVAKEFRQKHGDEAFGMLNILEDLRVEAAMAKRFPGSIANLAHAYAAAEKSATEKAATGEAIPLLRQLAFAVTARVQDRPMPVFIDPEAERLAGLIEREAFDSVQAPHTRAVAQLAESAWKAVKAHLPTASLSGLADGSKAPDATSGQSASSPGSNPSASSSSGMANSSANGGPSSTPDATSPSGDIREKRRRKGRTSEQGSNPTLPAAPGSGIMNGSVGGDGGTVGQGVLGDLAEDIAAAVNGHATTTGAYRVWTRAHDEMSVAEDHTVGGHAERMAPLMPHVSGVRQKLLQSLLAETRSRWLPDQEEGRHLNPRALHRLAARGARTCRSAPGEDVLGMSAHSTRTHDSPMSRRLFRKRVVTRRLETAVTLLIDLSHSMSSRKLDVARDTAMVMCEALSRLGIPVAVWGFSTRQAGKLLRDASQSTGIPTTQLEEQYRFAPLVHQRFKDFHEPFRKVSGRLAGMRTHMLTPLGESMLFAARELQKRPEPRRVLIVLTDGRPTVGMGNDISTYNHAHEAIRRIERAGVDVLLIGIVERCVLDLHHRAVVVERIEDLSRTVMTQMRKVLTDNRRIVYRQTAG